jgi:hypothetical protein
MDSPNMDVTYRYDIPGDTVQDDLRLGKAKRTIDDSSKGGKRPVDLSS